MILSGLLCIAGLTAAAWADNPTTQPATSPATTRATTAPSSPTTAVKRGALSVVIDSQGSFEPVDSFEVRIRPKVYSGEMTISSVVANGASVKKGDVLLEIDPAPIKRMISAADNELLSVRASLAKVEADDKIAQQADALALKQQENALKETQDSLKWFENADGPQFLKLADLSQQQFDDQVRDATDELEQLKKMYKSEELTNATADIVVRQAIRKLELAKEFAAIMKERTQKQHEFNYPILRQRFVDAAEMAKQTFALFQTAQAQQKVQRETGLAGVRAAVAASELRDSDLKADLEKLTVRAPADGIVSFGQSTNGNWQPVDPKQLRTGERATAQSVLMTVFTPGKLRLVVDVSESRYFAIKSGQKASISPVAFPELKYEGLCEPEQRSGAGAGGSYALRIATGEVDSRLAPGMKATVHMDVPLVDGALLVPTTAVANSTVWVKNGETEESRKVLTGRSDGKLIEILSGLKEGDEVLTHAKAQ